MKNFVKILILAHSNGFSVTFIRKNEQVEKSKYWRRNDGFSFLPEVRVTHLIDSPIVFFAGISLAGEWMNNQKYF